MKLAAGILFIAKDTGRALFLLRADGGDHPAEWCFPGGNFEPGETAAQAAAREAVEECGTGASIDPDTLQLWTRRQKDDVDFATFLCRVDSEFDIALSDEHLAFSWRPINEPSEPLHPGCRVALDRFRMDELGIARAIRDGDLTSPQRYLNVWLFDLRITGTGQAYRDAGGLDEHVWRPPAEYLNDDFLERCQGLPVIWAHPETKALNTKEFGDRVIGSIMLPYVKGQDVWGVAKIHDGPAALEMVRRAEDGAPLSTSPGVIDVGDNRTVLADGSEVLVEEKPRLLDHLAICEAGVWDKGGPPTGVASVTTDGEQKMSETEDKAAEEKAEKRADASAGGEAPDKLLSKLDAVMDSLGKLAGRMDSFEKDREDKKDRKDSKSRRDELKAKCDAGGASEEEKAEFEKLDRKDSEMEDDSKKDSEEKERKDAAARKDKKDADEKLAKEAHELEGEAMKDAARVDSQIGKLTETIERQQKTIDQLLATTAPISDEVMDRMGGIQARCDSVAQMHGAAAPRPMPGEAPLAYRKRLIKPYVKHSAAWKGAADTLAVLPEAAFDIAEAQIYADAAAAAKNPASVPAGQLRPHSTRQGGHEIITYHGSPRAWMDPLSGPTRQRVTGSFKANGSAH